MATDKEIILKIKLEQATAKDKIKDLTASLDKLDGRTVKYKKAVAQLNLEKEKLSNVNKKLDDLRKTSTRAIKGTELAIRQEISALKQEQAAKATTNQSWIEYRLRIQQAEKELQDLTATQSKFIPSVKTLQKSTNKLSSGMTTLKSNTGLASGAALELGRVISDAPYGIRGMANNISQLASQLFFLAGQQDLSANATKSSTVATNQSTVAKGVNATATSAMATTEAAATATTYGLSGALKAMWASLMGPLGILLAIQAVISAIDYFYGSTSKAKEGVDDLSKSLNTLGGKTFLMNQYYNVLTNVNSSEQERKVAIQELEKLVPSLKDKEIDYRKELDKVRESIDSYVLSQASRIEIDKLVEQNSELLTKKATLRRINDIKDEKEKAKQIKKFLVEQSVELTKRERVGSNPYTGAALRFVNVEKSRKELKEDFDKIADEVEKSSQPILDRIDELRKGLEFVPKKDSTKKKTKGTRTEIDVRVNTDSFTNLMESDDWQSLLEDIDKMNTEVEEVGAYADDQRIQKEIDREAKEKKARLEKLEELKLYAEKSKEILASISNFVSAEFEREMTIEQNKTNAKNEQLNARLRNEKLSEEKRKEILNQIATNDEELRKKQEVIAKKKFKAEKAFNISMALVNTASAAAGVMAQSKGGFFARLAQALPTIAFGLAQVATISRQKYQTTASASSSSAVTSTGGSSTSSAEREMNFNIVGNSNSTQLVDAIQSKFDQPLKAYVVSREITSSQALESNIVETASL